MLQIINPKLFFIFLLVSGSLCAQGDWNLRKGRPPSRDLVSVCLYQEKSLQGIFGRKDWKSLVATPTANKCEERFLADIKTRELFFEFDSSFEWRGSRPDDAICFGTGTSYTGCTSVFFDAFPNGINKEMNAEKALDALVKSNAFASLDKLAKSQLAYEEAERYTQYKLNFTAANTLETIEAFATKYASSDVDKLIPKLEPLRLRLARNKYLNDYKDATTLGAMLDFRASYQTSDTDTLLPEISKRINILQVQEARATAKAQADREIFEQEKARVENLQSAEVMIRLCQKLIDDTKTLLQREKQIEATSGVANLQAKRKAGELIVECQESITASFKRYQQLSGKKSLREIIEQQPIRPAR